MLLLKTQLHKSSGRGVGNYGNNIARESEGIGSGMEIDFLVGAYERISILHRSQ